VRDLVGAFRSQTLVLFKLLLLERKILFRGKSTGELTANLLSLVSLLPLQVEYGLEEATGGTQGDSGTLDTTEGSKGNIVLGGSMVSASQGTAMESRTLGATEGNEGDDGEMVRIFCYKFLFFM
jgi:hypothetical protein